ncbi:hypothetical protein JCM3774_004429 [Rhodotorula dairenensis]
MSNQVSTSGGDKASLVQRKVEQGINLAKQDAAAVTSFGTQALKSTAYLYPVYGVIYLAKHPRLVETLKPMIVRSLAISMVTVSAMFTFTYLPQVAALSVISGPLAFIAAVPLVLAETYAIIMFIHRTFLNAAVSERIFDAILVQKGFSDLVENGRSLSKRGGSVELGKSILSPVKNRFSTAGIVRYLVTLPLNFIPGVGTAIFLVLNGRKAGPSAHDRYFQLKKFSKQQREQFVEKRSAAYTSFGIASIALSLVPLFGPAFMFTTAAGAALWAADIERNERGSSGGKDEAGGKDLVEEVHPGRLDL